MMHRQSGALLLMVALLLATLAALSFGLNRAAGVDAASVQADYDVRVAGYLAEAAVGAAKWSNQIKGCTANQIGRTAFGAGTFFATVTQGGSKRLNIAATGRVGDDTVRTLERNNVDIVDFSKKTTTTELAAAALDTTIASGSNAIDGGNTDLALVSATRHALLYWPATEISADSRVLSATLTLVQSGSDGTRSAVALHRMMTPWDAAATWLQPRPGYRWTGGDYASGAVATTTATSAGSRTWDITPLVDGWVSRRLANYGMLLRLPAAGQAIKFYSREASTARRPVLQVTTAKAC